MITFRELRQLCARYEEMQVRVNHAKYIQQGNTVGTNSKVKDNSENIAALEAKMDAIQFKVAKHAIDIIYD